MTFDFHANEKPIVSTGSRKPNWERGGGGILLNLDFWGQKPRNDNRNVLGFFC